jgi:hypothetical protein
MKSFLLSCILALTFHFVSAQNKTDTINLIQQKVTSIDRETNYWISTINNEAFLDTGFIRQAGQGYGSLTGYFKNGKVCKIKEMIGIRLLHQIAYTEYYFSEGKLIYVYEEEHEGPDIFIDTAGTMEHAIESPAFTAKYYFSNDKMIGRLEDGERKTMLLPDEKFFDSQSKEGQLLYAAQKYHAMFSIKYKQ